MVVLRSPPPSIGSTSANAWWGVSLFCAAAILSYTDRQILSLLVDPIRADLMISDTKVGLLQGLAFAVIYSVAGLPLGRLADIWSRKFVLLAGIALWSAATAACAWSATFEALFAARFFVGVGEAALAPAAMSMISDLFPENRRGTATGVFVMGMLVGSGVALAVGALLLSTAEAGSFAALPLIGPLAPWRQVLVLLGATGVPVLVLLATVSEPVRQTLSRSTASMGGALQALWSRKAQLGPLYAAMAFVSLGDFALLAWLPTMLARRFELAPSTSGVMLGSVAIVAGIAGTLAGGMLADRAASRGGCAAQVRLAQFATMIAVPGALIAIASTATVTISMFALWLLMSSAVGTVGVVALQASVPSDLRGLSIAMVSFCNILLGLGLGSTLPPLLAERLLSDAGALGLSLTIVVLPSAIAAAFLFSRTARAARIYAGKRPQ